VYTEMGLWGSLPIYIEAILPLGILLYSFRLAQDIADLWQGDQA